MPGAAATSGTLLSPCGRGRVGVPFRRDLSAQLLRLGTGAAAADDTALALHGVAGFSLQSAFRALIGVARRGIDEALRSAIEGAMRRDLSNSSELADVAHAHPRHPEAAALRREVSAGTFVHESEGERRFARLFRPGDPQPVWQAGVLPGIRADGAYPEAPMTLEWARRQWHLQPGDQDRDSTRSLRLAEARIEEIIDPSALGRCVIEPVGTPSRPDASLKTSAPRFSEQFSTP